MLIVMKQSDLSIPHVASYASPHCLLAPDTHTLDRCTVSFRRVYCSVVRMPGAAPTDVGSSFGHHGDLCRRAGNGRGFGTLDSYR